MLVKSLAPVCQVGKVLEEQLFVAGEVPSLFGRRQLGLLGGKLLVKVGHILQSTLKQNGSFKYCLIKLLVVSIIYDDLKQNFSC